MDERAIEIGVHTVGTAISVAALLLLDDPVASLRLTSVIMGITCLIITVHAGRTNHLVLTPVSFLFAFKTISLGASVYTMAGEMERGTRILFSRHEVSNPAIVKGHAIFLVGLLMFHIGMQLPRPKRTPPPKEFPPALMKATFAVWVFGVFITIVHPHIQVIDGYARGTTAGLIVAGLYLAARDRAGFRLWTALLVGTAVEFVLNLRSGSKAYIMFSFVPIAWVLLARERLRVLFLPLGGAMLGFYLMIVAPVVTTARELGSGMAAGAALIEVWQSGNYGADAQTSLNASLDRQYDSTPTAFFVDEVERYGHINGETLMTITYAFIPRVLWPEKPEVTQGAWFTAYLGAARKAEEATTSTGMTAVGELFWNFGVIGVIIGMIPLGLLAGVVWRIAGPHPETSPLRMIVYVSLLFSTLNQPEAVTVITGYVIVFVSFAIPIVLIDRYRAQAHAMRQATG